MGAGLQVRARHARMPAMTLSPIQGGAAALCLAGGAGLLLALSKTDMETRLLPNRMVAAFAALGLAFHLATAAAFLAPLDIVFGGLAGFGALYLVRAAANRVYGTDALGLGDVKLIGAAGLWLGPEGVMLALALGAAAGAMHGVFYALRDARKTGTRPNFAALQIPAGPGFAAGIAATAAYEFGRSSLW